MAKSCCPAYIIRLNVNDFKITKSQKQVLKRFNKYLVHGKSEKTEAKEDADMKSEEEDEISKKENAQKVEKLK